MTLEAAVKLCLKYFGPELPKPLRWREGAQCYRSDSDGWCQVHNVVSQLSHDIPLPEPSDELAAALREVLTQRRQGWRISYDPDRDAIQAEVVRPLGNGEIEFVKSPWVSKDRDAIIFACAELADAAPGKSTGL